jgi:hypothetical protein
MCVLAPVRNFSVVCFEGVTGNSVGSALSIRSGRPLAHFEATTGSFWADFKRRAIVIFLPQTAGTYPPLTSASKPRHVGELATAGKLASASGRTSALAPLSGHKNIIRLFWVKLFVARFWRDFKESEAVCVNYFCEAVPFWE